MCVWSKINTAQMSIKAVVLAACLLSLTLVEAFLWSNFVNHGRAMITKLDATKSLFQVKKRYDGRQDIATMADEPDISMKDLFDEADREEVDPPTVGQTVSGVVIEMDDNGALIEIGGKMSGFLPIKEAALITLKHMADVLEVGQQVTGEVIGTLKGMPVISLRNAQLVSAWEEILKFRAEDLPFEVKVLEVNKGGAVCLAFGLKAFLPGSHFHGLADESLIGTNIMV